MDIQIKHLFCLSRIEISLYILLLISECAYYQSQDSSGQHLVTCPSQVTEVRRRERGEDDCCVWNWSEDSLLMLIPHKGIPVEKEHKAGTYQCPRVLGKNVMRHLNTKIIIFYEWCENNYLNPFQFSNSCQSYCYCRIEMAPRDPNAKNIKILKNVHQKKLRQLSFCFLSI